MEENRPQKCIAWVGMTGMGESGAGMGDENTGIDKGEAGMDRKDTRIGGRGEVNVNNDQDGGWNG